MARCSFFSDTFAAPRGASWPFFLAFPRFSSSSALFALHPSGFVTSHEQGFLFCTPFAHLISDELFNTLVAQFVGVARSVAQNGIIRLVSNQTGGRLEISREQPTLETTKLEGDPVTEDGWGRLVARLNDKARQAKGAGPVWVRLEEISGLWHFTPLQGMTLQEKLGVLLPDLQKE